MKRWTILIATLLGLGSVMALTGFGSPDTAPAAPKLIVAHADQLLPSETATDWVTYSDHLVVATMTGERKLAASAEEQRAGEGFIPRVVTLRVDEVLWSRPGARTAPKTVDMDLDGWRFKGDKLTPVRLEGEPMLTAGSQYVLPLTYLDVTKTVTVAGWSALSMNSILPYKDGVIGKGDIVAGYAGPTEPSTAVRDSAWQKPLTSLVSTLRSAQPDPNAAEAMTLPPDQRYQAVASR
jgi:hypothetical protein